MKITPFRRAAFFVIIDAALVAASVAMALLLRYDGHVPASVRPGVLPVVLVGAGAAVAAFAALRLYRVTWAFFALRDVARVAVGTGLATVALGAYIVWTQAAPASVSLPRSVALIQAPLTFCLVSAFRLSRRAVRTLRSRRHSTNGTATLLVGAGEAGAQVVRSIQSTGAPYRVVGFLDDDPQTRGAAIESVPVLGPVAHLEDVVRRRGVKTVVVTVASAPGRFVQDVVRASRRAGVQDIRIVPPLSQIVDGQVSIAATREVSLEDLLGRDAVRIDADNLRGLLAGRRVLVTGGAGTIGSELCRQIARYAPERLIVLDVDETRLHDLALELRQASPSLDVREALVDVRDERALARLFAAEKPALAFHAAAYKHVPMMERHPLSALDVNVLGTARVAACAEAAGCERLVLVSTDKAVEPSSVMGASKRLAELALFSSSGRMKRSAVRFGNVIGSRGSVIPVFEKQLARGGPLTVTHPEVERYFMMTSEAVSLVLQAAALGEGNDLFVLDMGKPVRILDVARELVRLHGLEPDVDVKIEITGLRPGEKLSESLLYPHERPSGTGHPRILRAKAPARAMDPQLPARIEALRAAQDDEGARALLASLFPTLAL